MITFFAPPLRCAPAFSFDVNKPVHSRTTSTPSVPHGSVAGSRCASTLMRSPLTTIASPSTATLPECAVRGVIACQMRVRLTTPQIVDRDDREIVLLAAFVVRAQNVAADAAIAVDRDFDGHSITP